MTCRSRGRFGDFARAMVNSDGGFMANKRRMRVVAWLVAGGFLGQMSGCLLDPDILLRAGLSVGSDLTVFLLENLFASI